MALDPKTIHMLDQITGLTGEVAQQVAAYKKKLIAEGMTEVEAWALAQRLEERLMGPVFDDAEDLLKDPAGDEQP